MFREGAVYHIYNRANGEDDIFREERNYQYFLDKYCHHLECVVDTYAYCLLRNHFHLMVRVKENVSSKTISSKFSNFFNAYSKAFNKTYGRRGSLFQRPFKHKEVTNEVYFTQLLLYIHLNPVKHGFVEDVHQWPHSSFRQYFLDGRIVHVRRGEVLNWFGGIIEFENAHQCRAIPRSVFE
jgi:REP element-mobilizing transposase RayT